ncbi:MEDS domain-containing protein [Halorussus sp. MSC15.2]|uniref:MEDS domain-containing protein n=1 Tax=Halorussus sp. MSC15.2 TaxID=2283638 RepID=UPI0013D7C989|nr:MEDS domain-containing protein [Halorussus sp. MSC15.2]NEU57834.1 PAS domain S-box protein [Halorussus sp. MSC15.2]
MSKHIGRSDRKPSTASDAGFEALQSTAGFRGPVEPLDGHEHADHLALVYEDRAEQLATVVPFVADGLARDERCMYIVDDSSREEIIDALRSDGVDVEDALDAGQLSFHSVEEMYLSDGEFDVERARDSLGTVAEAAQDEYEGFRVTAEETWLVGDDAAQRKFMACEAHVNELLDGEAGMALCQYDRTELPPTVIEDVINTHPYLVYDETACPNDFYTPPEEYFAPDNLARENERKLETLLDRTEGQASLGTRERYERELYDITSDPDLGFEEKLDALFDLGCERFNLDIGGLAKVDPETDFFEVEAVSDDHDFLVPGANADLSETYCEVTTDFNSRDAIADPVAVTDPVGEGFEGKRCYEQFGVRTYLGTYLTLDGTDDRTFWFVSTEPRESEFSEAERTFHRLMGQWVEYELERQHRERELRRAKDQFEAVFENSNDAIFVNDPFGDEIVDANPAGLEMLGYEREELLARGPSDCHPDEMGRFRAFVDGVFANGHGWTDELSCLTKDGRAIPAEISASTIELDDRELMLAIVRDITERKEHEQYQRELYDIIADPRVSFGDKVENLLELGSERFDFDIGYFTRTNDDDTFEIVEAIGDHDLIQSGVTDSLCDTYCEKLLASSGAVSVTDAAEEGWTDDAAYERFGLDAYFATTVEVGGDEYGTLCFASEMPRDRAYTDAERTFLDLMGQCVSYELNRNHREVQLEEKNARLENFASMLAHELRNPVNIGQIYGQQLPADGNAEAVGYITEAFDRIEDIIDVMLMLTRGRDAVGEHSAVDLGTVARDVWDDIDTRGATSEVAIDSTIEADETYVQHLFRNLFENAVEHGSTGNRPQDDNAAEHGSTSPRSQAHEDAVEHGSTGNRPRDDDVHQTESDAAHQNAQRSEDAVEHGGADVTVTVGELPTGFYVADDGSGIPDDDKNAVFEEGYTSAASNGGMGLGLAFVQKLAEIYEWDCAVTESDEGGARFEFRNVT